MAGESFAALFFDAEVGVRQYHGQRARAGIDREGLLAVERVHRRLRAEFETARVEVAREGGAQDGLATVGADELEQLALELVLRIELAGIGVPVIAFARGERGEIHVPTAHGPLPGDAGFAGARALAERNLLAAQRLAR